MKIIAATTIEAIQIYTVLSNPELYAMNKKIIQYVNAHVITLKNQKIKFHLVEKIWISMSPHFMSCDICVKNDYPYFDYFIVDEVIFYNSTSDFILARHLSRAMDKTGFILN